MAEAQLAIYTQTLDIGCGSIGPDGPIARGEYDEELVKQAEFAAITDSTLYDKAELNIPIQCADGRTTWVTGGSAIGGSFTPVIADALTLRRYLQPQMSAKDHAGSVYSRFLELGLSVGGHCDDIARAPNSGCGGMDRLGSDDPDTLSILGFVSRDSAKIRNFLENLYDSLSGASLNIKIDDRTHDLITDNAQDLEWRSRGSHPYATNGLELCAALKQNKGQIETLHGPHREVLAVVDLRDGLALNRALFSARFGGLIQAFYINVVSITKAAELLYSTDEERDLAFAGALYYNVAATAVLAGPSLRVAALS